MTKLCKASLALTLGPGQFGHSGKPAAKPSKPSRMQLREAYMLTIRAIHAKRADFFSLKAQDKKATLITTAKTLAKLVSAKSKAHHRLIKASRPKFSQEAKILLNWKTPARGSQVFPMQNVKVSQLYQPLQLPFQLLWPPDCHQPEPNERSSKMESECLPEECHWSRLALICNPEACQRPSSSHAANPGDHRSPPISYANQKPDPEPDPVKPTVRPKSSQWSAPNSMPDLPPDPDPDSSVSKEDWGKGSIDPG